MSHTLSAPFSIQIYPLPSAPTHSTHHTYTTSFPPLSCAFFSDFGMLHCLLILIAHFHQVASRSISPALSLRYARRVCSLSFYLIAYEAYEPHPTKHNETMLLHKSNIDVPYKSEGPAEVYSGTHTQYLDMRETRPTDGTTPK